MEHRPLAGRIIERLGRVRCRRLCLGALGTDTGVSVRGPASWLGLVGVRPSYGRVSVRGTFPRAYTLDTVGPLAHTVADAATLLTAIAGFDPQDPFAVPSPDEDCTNFKKGVKKLRLGVVEDFTFRNINPEVKQAVQAALDLLEDLGAEIKTVSIPLPQRQDRLPLSDDDPVVRVQPDPG